MSFMLVCIQEDSLEQDPWWLSPSDALRCRFSFFSVAVSNCPDKSNLNSEGLMDWKFQVIIHIRVVMGQARVAASHVMLTVRSREH